MICLFAGILLHPIQKTLHAYLHTIQALERFPNSPARPGERP
jgi:hypothetical protein